MNGSPDHKFVAMENTIIYFTGTGNSLAIARLLAGKLGQTEIISVTEMLSRSDLRLIADTCGFVFPVNCQDAPEIVKRLIRLARIPTNAYVYAIATHNGDPGYSHFTLDRILGGKGQCLQAGFAILMPGNSIAPYNSTNSEEETNQRLSATASRVAEIADSVAKREQIPYAGSASLQKRLKGFHSLLRHRVFFNVPRNFWVTDTCNLCGLCVRICPENNISINADTVKWGKHCQICLACIHWCPQRAIQNGQGTINRKRYHHPDISINDMLCRE
jgi:formate hydrogenlyase subunit 6/NADH:ubiquinone oxidoreductase subunit I